MTTARKPRWQNATALVSLSTCGAMTAMSFAHGTAADLTSPTSVPVHLTAFSRSSQPAAASDSALRAAIVSAAKYYLRLAQNMSPGGMEALIWQNDSLDGVDHGESCAAFASLALEAGARASGQQSWVTGGTTYPWPLHSWVDARVDPNPDSLNIVSVLQDAQAHNRWHPLGDGYTPQPGDWVLFDGHVEVVTQYAGGVLDTIGGDSLPNMSVNAHQYPGSLAAQGVQGFVDNGELVSAAESGAAPGGAAQGGAAQGGAAQGGPEQGQPSPGQADVPGLVMPEADLSADGTGSAGSSVGSPGASGAPAQARSAGPALAAAGGGATVPGAEPVTGSLTSYAAASATPRYGRSQAAPTTLSVPGTSAPQQAFINQVAPGAMAAQRAYGVPAAVTIAQAIDESGWGQSELATQDNNLFGIKGTGPAGSVMLPTQEYENGQWVTIEAPFRAYSNVAQSITDHALLLATGSAYQQAMSDRSSPDAFANDLTGVYATDPNYGTSLISLMEQYNLYRFDAASATTGQTTNQGTLSTGGSAHGGAGQGASGPGAAVQQAGVAHGAAEQNGTRHGGTQPSRSRQGGIQQAPAVQGAAVPGTGGAGGPGGAGETAGAGGAGEADGANVPGVLDDYAGTAATSGVADGSSAHVRPAGGPALRAGPANTRVSTRRYAAQMPHVVTTDFITTAKAPLLRAKPLYQDIASEQGIRWQLLAACDWMQCQAQPRLSPVHGEKLGTRNSDGTVFRTKSQALEQCAADLIMLAEAIYGVDLRQRLILSVRELARVFAAFRWGGLLKAHRISAMEFPYSVEGLSAHHMKMRWPDIGEPAPDRPGARFRQSFGAVPVVLGLDLTAVA